MAPNHKSKSTSDGEAELFAAKEVASLKPKRCAYEGHVWTKNKAYLIERYLRRFIQVTKSGIYIDAFAGTQRSESSEHTWAARLALNIEPKWIRRFYLFEMDQKKIHALEELRKKHHKGWLRKTPRKVIVRQGDSNSVIPNYFSLHSLSNTPTFCLLDQRTRECSWALVSYLSKLKKNASTKPEIFYFLAQGWMDRHWEIITPKNQERIRAWWGGDGWKEFRKLGSVERAEMMEKRFRNELGYKFAQAFPIHKYGNHGRVMFWMIHASDDPRALPFMAASYSEIGLNLPQAPAEQIDFIFGIT